MSISVRRLKNKIASPNDRLQSKPPKLPVGAKKEMAIQLLWAGRKSRAGASCFASQFTFGNIWLCLITLQIYGRGDNMLMLMILCEETPELWAPDQGSEDILPREAWTVNARPGQWPGPWLFSLICQVSGSGRTDKGWGCWPFLDGVMDEYWIERTCWQKNRRSKEEGLTSPGETYWDVAMAQNSKRSRNEDCLLGAKTGILINI